MTEEFKKYDTGKLEYDMFPDNVLEGIIKVMMYGAKTKGYGKDNWKKCTDIRRYYNASRRHQAAWKAGEYYDAESGLPHVFHQLCNDVFIAYLEEERVKNDNTNNSETVPGTTGTQLEFHLDYAGRIYPVVRNTEK